MLYTRKIAIFFGIRKANKIATHNGQTHKYHTFHILFFFFFNVPWSKTNLQHTVQKKNEDKKKLKLKKNKKTKKKRKLEIIENVRDYTHSKCARH